MHCRADGCLPEVRAALLALPGVADATLDFNTKTAIVSLAPGAALNRAAVSAALREAGYGLTTFDRLP
ncbi:MAG: heavy metal-associated domain-containing protein [Deltaproteobacteria bacterium]|nr:heavy metal-associated domain-containing protein [Deltaproteobacteria bacterium]